MAVPAAHSFLTLTVERVQVCVFMCLCVGGDNLTQPQCFTKGEICSNVDSMPKLHTAVLSDAKLESYKTRV